MCDIPDSPSSSFFRGQSYVSDKDSVFNGSDPLRHIVELLAILGKEPGGYPPYLDLFSEGGADPTNIYFFVQCVLLALFRIADLDILNVGRCAPHQSYINPGKTCMSLLNISLQGPPLKEMTAEYLNKQFIRAIQ